MRWEICGRGIGIDESLRDHILRRFGTALDRFERQVGAIAVSLEDLNGPRGGRDTRCRVRARLRRGGQIILAITDRDASVAVDRAADGLGYQLGRLARHRARGGVSMAGPSFSPTRRDRVARFHRAGPAYRE